MQTAPPCPVPVYWWQIKASGLLLHWQLQLGTYSVCVCVCVCVCVFSLPGFALWDSNIPHRPTCERVSYCFETSPPSRLPPQVWSLPLTLLSPFLFFIVCPASFWREWAHLLGTWCPPPAFRSCFVEVAQHSNDFLMKLQGRKWYPHPIPLSFWDHPENYILMKLTKITLFFLYATTFLKQYYRHTDTNTHKYNSETTIK